jgi:hypothetical protein
LGTDYLLEKENNNMQDYSICLKNIDGKHTPDWNTISLIKDGDVYIDVSCSACEHIGCLGKVSTIVDEISW